MMKDYRVLINPHNGRPSLWYNVEAESDSAAIQIAIAKSGSSSATVVKVALNVFSSRNKRNGLV